MRWYGQGTWCPCGALTLPWNLSEQEILDKFVCSFVWCVYVVFANLQVCFPGTCGCGGQRRTLDTGCPAVSLYLIPLRQDFFFPDRFCFNFLISLPGQQAPVVLFSLSSTALGLQVQGGHAWPLTRVLGIWTRDFMLAQPALFSTEPPSNLWTMHFMFSPKYYFMQPLGKIMR